MAYLPGLGYTVYVKSEKWLSVLGKVKCCDYDYTLQQCLNSRVMQLTLM